MRTRIVLAQVTNHKFLIHNARLPSQHHKGPTIRKVVGVGGGEVDPKQIFKLWPKKKFIQGI